MSDCQDIHKMMAEALYDDLDEDRRKPFNAHLQSCPDCARLYQQMAETLRIMDARETTEPGEAFWSGYTEHLAGRLKSQLLKHRTLPRRKPFFGSSNPLSHPVLRVGAIAALVLVGIFIGKLIWREEHHSEPAGQAMISTQRQTDPAIIEAENRAQSYLQKSKVLLLALDNFDPETDDAITLNLQSQRRISESLVQEAEYLKTALDDPAETRLRELVGDLEIILLQIANLEDEHDLAAVEMVQRGVDKQGVLFRIDLSKVSGKAPEESPSTNPKLKNQNHI
jgi:hypothetical protein